MKGCKLGRVMTYEEVAQKIGITAGAVQKSEESALRKLRRSPILFLQFAEYASERQTNNLGTIQQGYSREEI